MCYYYYLLLITLLLLSAHFSTVLISLIWNKICPEMGNFSVLKAGRFIVRALLNLPQMIDHLRWSVLPLRAGAGDGHSYIPSNTRVDRNIRISG